MTLKARSILLLIALCATGHMCSAQATAKPPTAASNQQMDFSDTPDFKIAGVTDWTAVGGHGSDATLRTSEELARETLALKSRIEPRAAPLDAKEEAQLRSSVSAAPSDYAANHALGMFYLEAGHDAQAIPFLEAAAGLRGAQPEDEYALALACRALGDFKQSRKHIERALTQKDEAKFHRLAGDLDETLGDALAAVDQDERATRLEPSEENYFAWGSELLLHRAVWQAIEVFKSGVQAHPASARLLTGLGSALFAGALYEEAAQRLCAASDLAPQEYATYALLGKIEAAAPGPLPCVQEKLSRFMRAQPENPTANYLYAMSVLKGETPDLELVNTLLMKTITLDPKYAPAYLQLGTLAFKARDQSGALQRFRQAIEADPQLAEAHYRLGVTYDRLGDAAAAQREFATHDELERAQANAVERERREVKQFTVVLEKHKPQ